MTLILTAPRRFFAQIFIFFLLHQSAISLFRVIGSLGRSKVVSNTFGAFAMIVLFLLSGFILSKGEWGRGGVREGVR